MSDNQLPSPSSNVWRRFSRDTVDRLFLQVAPFESDEEYMNAAALLCQLRRWLSETDMASERTASDEEISDIEDGYELLTALNGRFEKRCEASLQAEMAPPRALQIATRLDASSSERQMLEIVVINSSDARHGGINFGPPDLKEVGRLLELSPPEVIALSEASLFTEGILELEDPGIVSKGLNRDIEAPWEVVKALWGIDLTPKELLRVEETPLGDILASERPGSPPQEPSNAESGDVAHPNRARSDTKGATSDGDEKDQQSSTRPSGSASKHSGQIPAGDAFPADRRDGTGIEDTGDVGLSNEGEPSFSSDDLISAPEDGVFPTAPLHPDSSGGAEAPQDDLGPYPNLYVYWEEQLERLDLFVQLATFDADDVYDNMVESADMRKRRLEAELRRATRRYGRLTFPWFDGQWVKGSR